MKSILIVVSFLVACTVNAQVTTTGQLYAAWQKDIVNFTAQIEGGDTTGLYNTYYRRGWRYLYLTKYEKAIADFTSSIAIKPFFKSYAYRAKAYYYLGDSANAYYDIIKATALAPDTDTIANLLLAKIEGTFNPNCNAAANALSAYTANLGHPGANAEFYESTALLCMCRHDTAGVISNYDIAFTKWVDPTQIYTRLKYLFYDTKYTKTIVADIDRLINMLADSTQKSGLYTLRAITNHLNGDTTGVLDDLNNALATAISKNDSAIAYYNLAEYQFFFGNCTLSTTIENHLAQAIALKPSFSNAYLLQSLVYYLLFKDAEKAFKTLQAAEPNIIKQDKGYYTGLMDVYKARIKNKSLKNKEKINLSFFCQFLINEDREQIKWVYFKPWPNTVNPVNFFGNTSLQFRQLTGL